MSFYPALLSLKDRDVVVIGGGGVAERKVLTLLKAGAAVTVVSPTLTRKLGKLQKSGIIHYRRESYRKRHVQKAFLVIAATSSAGVNERIATDAPCLVNVVNLPEKGNFIVPSTLRRGALTIAVSTEGASPALSKTIRKELESQYGREFAMYVRFLEKTRKRAAKNIRDSNKRRRFLTSLSSPETINLLRKKGYNAVVQRIESLLTS